MPNTSNSTDHANVVAPAPVFYVVTFIAGLVAHYMLAIPIMPDEFARNIGALLILVSIPIVLSAVYELRKAGTAFDARKSSTALVTSGIFRLSRNPTYLSMTLLFAGIALAMNSLTALLTVAVAVALTQIFVIRREEHYMAAKFGDEYQQYKKMVRPWV